MQRNKNLSFSDLNLITRNESKLHLKSDRNIITSNHNLSKELKKEKAKCLPIHLLQGVLKTAYVKGIKNSA